MGLFPCLESVEADVRYHIHKAGCICSRDGDHMEYDARCLVAAKKIWALIMRAAELDNLRLGRLRKSEGEDA